MNDHFIEFHQLVQTVRMNNTNHFYSSKQTEWSLYSVSSKHGNNISDKIKYLKLIVLSFLLI